jgi:hypothetical protein
VKKLIRAKWHTEPSDIFSPGVILPDFLHPDSHILHNGVKPSKCCCSRILLIGLLFFHDILLRISNKQGENHFPIVGTVVYGRFLKWNTYMKVLED